MAASKSEKEMLLNYTIQQFSRQFFHAISSVQRLSANASHFFSPKTFMKI
jgi:hypothetical protein